MSLCSYFTMLFSLVISSWLCTIRSYRFDSSWLASNNLVLSYSPFFKASLKALVFSLISPLHALLTDSSLFLSSSSLWIFFKRLFFSSLVLFIRLSYSSIFKDNLLAVSSDYIVLFSSSCLVWLSSLVRLPILAWLSLELKTSCLIWSPRLFLAYELEVMSLLYLAFNSSSSLLCLAIV